MNRRDTVSQEETMSKDIRLLAAGFLLCFATIAGERLLQAEPQRTGYVDSLMLSRACAFDPTAWTEVDCSAGDVYSGQLPSNSRIIVQAQGGSAYWRQDSASSGGDAAAGTAFLLPSSSSIDFYTRTGRYYLCDGNETGATGGKVAWQECQ